MARLLAWIAVFLGVPAASSGTASSAHVTIAADGNPSMVRKDIGGLDKHGPSLSVISVLHKAGRIRTRTTL